MDRNDNGKKLDRKGQGHFYAVLEAPPDISLYEFARLCISIRDDDEVSSILLALMISLVRAELDGGILGASLWAILDRQFNDISQN